VPDGADDEVVPSDAPATDPSAGASADQAAGSTAAGKHERKKPDRFWRELPILLLVSLAVAILIKTFLIQAFYIPSISMEPTLEKGDRILVCRICVHVSDIQRGDIIVFSNPHPGPSEDRGIIGSALHWLGQGLGVAQPENKDYVKRVIGLPGDVVEIRSGGQLFVNGVPVEEPYLNSEVDTRPFGPVTVPDGMLFVLGDNRAHSGDSRFAPPTGLGYVPEDTVIGKAFVIVYPPSRWGWL
jgi:signal peptidase I